MICQKLVVLISKIPKFSHRCFFPCAETQIYLVKYWLPYYLEIWIFLLSIESDFRTYIVPYLEWSCFAIIACLFTNSRYSNFTVGSSHFYTQEAPYIEVHKNILRSENPGKPDCWIKEKHMETFGSWLRGEQWLRWIAVASRDKLDEARPKGWFPEHPVPYMFEQELATYVDVYIFFKIVSQIW